MTYNEFIARRFPEREALSNPVVDNEDLAALDFSILYQEKLKDISRHIKAAGTPMHRLVLALIDAAESREDRRAIVAASIYVWFLEHGMPKSHFGNIGVDRTLKRVYVTADQLKILAAKMSEEDNELNTF